MYLVWLKRKEVREGSGQIELNLTSDRSTYGNLTASARHAPAPPADCIDLSRCEPESVRDARMKEGIRETYRIR
jgi:hypothetical protein